MDEARLRFLFGHVPEGGDPGGSEGRSRLLAIDRPGAEDGVLLVVAGQILDDEPAQAWACAQRLLGGGMDRADVLDQLVRAAAPFVRRVVHEKASFDAEAYVALLERLPLPGADAVFEAYLDVALERVVIDVAALGELVATRLGLVPGEPFAQEALDDCEQDVLEDPGSPVTMLFPDLVVHAPALVAGAVFTHRLSAGEHVDDHLLLDADLAGFARIPEPWAGTEPLVLEEHPGGAIGWGGPPAWLAAHPLDALLALRVDEDGVVTVESLGTEPVIPPGLVAALRAVYDRELAEPGLPVAAETLVLGMLHDDRTAFAQPRPPLIELAAAAGLQRRGSEFAHAESVWAAGAEADRHYRLMDRLGPGDDATAALEALDLLEGGATDPAALRRALELLAEPDVLEAAVEEWLGIDDDPERIAALVEVADRLIAAAGRSPRAASARWVAAVAAERDGRVLDAESHLRAAAAESEGWPFTEDRLAWYESDRGDAAAALGRWSAIGMPADDPEALALARFAVAAGPEPARNEPCWCGSGRKFKQCHLGRPALAPLPERVEWLLHKAAVYLDRRGGGAEEDLIAYAELRSPDLDLALADPLVRDVVLHEGGWWVRFLVERGPLLPPDEAELAASWTAVERTVYQVVKRTGDAVTVREMRTGVCVEVPEPALHPGAEPGRLVCGRAVPDGAGHRFVDGVFAVPAGADRELLEVLDLRDGVELLEWVAEPGEDD